MTKKVVKKKVAKPSAIKAKKEIQEECGHNINYTDFLIAVVFAVIAVLLILSSCAAKAEVYPNFNCPTVNVPEVPQLPETPSVPEEPPSEVIPATETSSGGDTNYPTFTPLNPDYLSDRNVPNPMISYE